MCDRTWWLSAAEVGRRGERFLDSSMHDAEEGRDGDSLQVRRNRMEALTAEFKRPSSKSFALFTLAFILGRVSRSAHKPEQTHQPPEAMDPDEQKHLYAPPKGHGKVSVPSTQSDQRGAIHNLQFNDFRVNVLESKPGTMRSGDVHKTTQFDFIFRGAVRVTTRERGRNVSRTYGAGSLIQIPGHIPHLFVFLNETIMAEWWDGPFEARYYRPYRAVIDAQTTGHEPRRRPRRSTPPM